MEVLIKRIKGALWISAAGFLATALTLTLQYIAVFNLTEQQQAIAIILGTSVVSQITKWLNTK